MAQLNTSHRANLKRRSEGRRGAHLVMFSYVAFLSLSAGLVYMVGLGLSAYHVVEEQDAADAVAMSVAAAMAHEIEVIGRLNEQMNEFLVQIEQVDRTIQQIELQQQNPQPDPSDPGSVPPVLAMAAGVLAGAHTIWKTAPLLSSAAARLGLKVAVPKLAIMVGSQVAKRLVLGFTGPVGWAVLAADLAVTLITGKTIEEHAWNAVKSAWNAVSGFFGFGQKKENPASPAGSSPSETVQALRSYKETLIRDLHLRGLVQEMLLKALPSLLRAEGDRIGRANGVNLSALHPVPAAFTWPTSSQPSPQQAFYFGAWPSVAAAGGVDPSVRPVLLSEDFFLLQRFEVQVSKPKTVGIGSSSSTNYLGGTWFRVGPLAPSRVETDPRQWSSVTGTTQNPWGEQPWQARLHHRPVGP